MAESLHAINSKKDFQTEKVDDPILSVHCCSKTTTQHRKCNAYSVKNVLCLQDFPLWLFCPLTTFTLHLVIISVRTVLPLLLYNMNYLLNKLSSVVDLHTGRVGWDIFMVFFSEFLPQMLSNNAFLRHFSPTIVFSKPLCPFTQLIQKKITCFKSQVISKDMLLSNNHS